MTRFSRLIRTVLPVAVVGATFAWATPASAATISVSTTAAHPGSSGDCTLGEAIQAANTDTAVDGCAAGSGDDVISLPVGTYTLNSVDHNSAAGPVALPSVSSNVRIDGANPSATIIERSTVGGTPPFMLFHMAVSTDDQCWPNCTLTVKDVTLQNAVGVGGAITNLAGRTILDNSTLLGNTEGPTVRSTGRLTVKDSLVSNNSSSGQGGVFKSDGDATLTGTTFSSNSGGAGGVLHFGPSATVTATNNQFSSNSAETGGALSGAGTLDVSGTTFNDNMATFGGGGGGAIGGVTGTVRVASSFFDGNSASGSSGGAISSDAALSVTGSTFEDNVSDLGGGVFGTGTSTSIKNSTFSANGANVRGGGVALSGGTATIANSTFAENFGSQGGGFSWEAEGGSLALRNSIVATNFGDTAFDCYSDSPISSQGYNLIGDATDCGIVAGTGDQLGTSETPVSPMLGSLDNYGGPTKTYALQVGSPAIDTGNPATAGGGGTSCEQFDQRNQARPRDGDDDGTFRCDIGSYEGGTGLPLLTADKNGTGTGLVSTVSDSTIDCGSDCAETYTQGTSVTLLATPTTDAEFTGWTGCSSVAGDQCTVSMDSDKTVTATFTDVQSILSVTRTGAGQGSVSSTPNGISCGLDCSELVSNGTTITLTASPAANSNFHFWSGCDSTNGTTCEVTMDEDTSVFAAFSPIVRTLTVNKAGGGTGTVTSDPEGIDCGSDCGESYQIFSEVTLTAVEQSGSQFTGWSGCDSETSTTCTVTVDTNMGVTATFAAPQFSLNVTKGGSAAGAITSSPAGINCPGDCTHDYDQGTSVTLTATPDANVDFTGWTGCDQTNGNQCTVDMASAEDVTGSFSPSRRTLNVSRTGAGTGTISSSSAGIDCGSDCTHDYDHGTLVTLTPAAGANSLFAGWTGCGSVVGNDCSVSMDGTKNVEASFSLVQRTLMVTKGGSGTGSVSSSPSGIDCGSDCTHDYDHGTTVTLTATAGTNWEFTGWTGCDSPSGNVCTVTADAAENVTASFGPIQRTLTVSKDGNGSGTVASSASGIDCGDTCVDTIDNGTWVSLDASPAAGSAFVSWTGCTPSSSNPKSCWVLMDQARDVTATFTTDPQTLSVNATTHMTGTGSVVSTPVGIDCGADCSEQFAPGTVVTLTPVPGPDSMFLEWEQCQGSTPFEDDTCIVTMDQAHTATAKFAPTTRDLLVVFEEEEGDDFATGTVDMDTSTFHMECDIRDGSCGENFFLGTEVTLTAHPFGLEVVSWQGCDSFTANQCTLTMDANENVTAVFGKIRRPIDVTKAGTGTGTVSSSPAGIECGVDCSENFVAWSSVELTATSGANSFFVGWTGCDSVNGNICTVSTTDEAQDVTASFGLVSRALTVSKQGSGTGTISSGPAGIDCGSDCSQGYEHGTSVTLTAVDGENSVFTGWSGCDSSVGDECTIAMDADETVTATFALAPRALTVAKSGNGTGSVSSAPAGIQCGVDCDQAYDHGTTVVLTAVDGANSEFGAWTGCDSVVGNECTIAMDAAKNVAASFALQQRSLEVTKEGVITGTVTSSPAGIDCGSDCAHAYDHGTAVTLTADGGANAVFDRWVGCDSSLGDECTVTMDGAEDITAAFTPAQRALAVSITGDGSVSSSPVGIDCGADCNEDYDHGTSVTLTATAGGGFALDSWTGCTSTSGTQCTVDMTAAKNVSVTFTNQPRTLTVNKNGAGTGTVSSSPAGVDCGSTCGPTFDAGAVVSLTPAPGASSSFSGWSGCDSVTDDECTVTMSANRTVTATFGLVDRTLSVQARRVTGDSAAAGSVTSNVGGIDCVVPNDCTQDYTHGSTVVLTASPAANNAFSNWSGCDDPQGVICTMTMTDAKTVTAEFHNNTIPSSSITSVPGATNDASPDFDYTADAGTGLSLSAVELWVDGPAAGSFVKVAEVTDGATSGSFQDVVLDEGDGSYQVKTEARNNAGNDENGTVRSFLLDTETPTSTVATPDVTQSINTFDLTWSSNHGTDLTGVAAVELWVNGPGVGAFEMVDTDPGAATGAFTFTVDEGAGAYAFHTVAVDAVGNREEAPVDIVVNVSLCTGYENDPRVHIVGTAGNDKLEGTAAAEVICGLGGNDTMRGRGGADLFVGASGKDTVTYSERTSKQPPVIVTVNNGANDGKKNEGDHVSTGIETVIGGKGSDILTGDGAANTIKGGAGNDNVKGGGGADKLYGDKGKDKLNGGAKRDVCKTGEALKACEVH